MVRRIGILGGGVTGLAAGAASGFPVFEAEPVPGGICSSYYMRPRSTERLTDAPADDEAYRFELGGGHWIFGGEPGVLQFIGDLVPIGSYARKSAVYFPEDRLRVPYPLQNHLSYLPQRLRDRALSEIVDRPRDDDPPVTMREWLQQVFGETLSELFFFPFHDRYTAGLYASIAPQDAYKSPVNPAQVRRGAAGEAQLVGYNVRFVYPRGGLNLLAQRMAARADVRYGRRAVRIDPAQKVVEFEAGERLPYDVLISTLPLNRVMTMAGLSDGEAADPSTAVLVVNIGARRGAQCPEDHWIYIPRSRSGFHRVGFYSNVDRSFLPRSQRDTGDSVSLYVETAYRDGRRPDPAAVRTLTEKIVEELQAWDVIEDTEAIDPTWIDVAYTWSWPGSSWRIDALQKLEKVGIIQTGRYGRWTFQGIADSIRDGLMAGRALHSA